MLKGQPTFWISSFLILLLFSCSTNRKGLLNKEYHTLTTRYNVLFNGKEAFDIGESILEQAFEDNFYQMLPLEPINLRGENVDQTTIVPGFDRAEEKAVKAIQKHSIKINEVQYNRQMDEAYLLLGKARYFDRRFFPALEAFNFLLKSGANRSVFVEGKIWREKTNIRLQNYELAIRNLRPLAMGLYPGSKFYPLANATLADAFINLKKLDSAAFYLKKAALEAPKRKTKARYLFITGQLFEQLGKKDSAQWAYQNIINLKRKAQRKFYINAKIKRTVLNEVGDYQDRIDQIQRLLKNYENQPFEHILNRAIGNIYLEEKQDSLALIYFNRSLNSNSIDSYTQIENYRNLADYYFEKGNYLETGSYLDKLLPLFEESTIDFKKLKRKRDNLSEVIQYEQVLKDTDSVIRLVSMSEQGQRTFFENYLDRKQLQEKKALEQEAKKNQIRLNNKTKTAFYFYNPNLILQGKQSYRALWGNRPNVDNWRSAAAIQNTISQSEESENTEKSKTNEILQQTPDSFIAALPKTKKEKDSIRAMNLNAYLQLGMIYKEKFSNYPLARKRLDTLLSFEPPQNLVVQALYHLYRMDENQNNQRANRYKKRLIEEYSETPFARLLSDPENYSTDGIITPQTLYANALNLYKEQDFLKVLEKTEELGVLTSGSPLEPKIALLKANTMGRLKGVKAWKKELEQVATNYSAVQEGKHAKEILDKIQSSNNLEEKGVVYKNYKWIFPFLNQQTDFSTAFFVSLKKNLSTSKRNWTVTKDPYDEEYTFVVVHGIRDPQEVENWKQNQSLGSLSIETIDNFVALSSQYRSFIKNKNWIKPHK
jgi:tetratricopeptide (TPR) repeat protein